MFYLGNVPVCFGSDHTGQSVGARMSMVNVENCAFAHIIAAAQLYPGPKQVSGGTSSSRTSRQCLCPCKYSACTVLHLPLSFNILPVAGVLLVRRMQCRGGLSTQKTSTRTSCVCTTSLLARGGPGFKFRACLLVRANSCVHVPPQLVSQPTSYTRSACTDVMVSAGTGSCPSWFTLPSSSQF